MRAKSLSVLMLAVALTVVARPAWASEEGLVGLWSFEEEEGVVVKDSSPNGLTGKIIFPEHVKRVEGKVGKALILTGEMAINECSGAVVPNINHHDFTKGFTIEVWIKFREDRKRSDTCFIATDGAFKGPGWRFLIHYDILAFQSGDGKKMWGVSSVPAKQGGFKNNRWYHVAGTFDGSAYRAYIDGVEVAVSKPEASQPMTKGGKTLTIGCYGAGRSSLFKGTLDEMKIYRRAKSPLEIVRAARIK